MIDIHTHILPGIDDGSDNMSDSIRMVRMSYESGVDSLVVTPHCNIIDLFENYYDKVLISLFQAFKEEVKKANIPVNVYLGMEVYATEEVPGLLYKGKLSTINQSRYLLIEFGFREDPILIEFLISEITNLGYIPIIAHPERYPYVQQRPSLTSDWLEQGCLLQVNKGSIIGNFGHVARSTAKHLLDRGMVSFVASDTHSPLHRTPDLSKVYQYLKSMYSEDYAKILLEDNARRVIENKEIIKLQQRKELQSTNLSDYHTKRG